VAYEQAIHLDPYYARAYNNMGSALNELGRYEEALVALKQTIRLDPKDANAYNEKYFALSGLGKKKEANQAHKKARQLGYSS
jgi:Flp pilus assembly protein TadD